MGVWHCSRRDVPRGPRRPDADAACSVDVPPSALLQRSRTADMVEVRDAATVMLVRDGDAGMEVLMLMRNVNSDVRRRRVRVPRRCRRSARPSRRPRPVLHRPHRRRGERSARHRTAAASRSGSRPVRECFEEAGILLAYDADGEMVQLDDPAVESRFVTHRAAIDHKERRLIEVCARGERSSSPSIASTTSATGSPPRAPLVATTRASSSRALPTSRSRCTTTARPLRTRGSGPQDALDAHDRGEFEIIFPTIKNLSAIGRFDDADELVAAAANAKTVPTVTPRIVQEGEQMRILLPGDPGY